MRSYDSEGEERWTRQIGTRGIDVGRDVAEDGSGNVYLVGSTEGAFPGQAKDKDTKTDNDAFVVKLSGSP